MSLSLRSFSTTVSTAVTTAQASCSQLLDVSIGSPVRALMESVGGVGLWLQYLVLQSLLRTRLSTSTGSDCDSFVYDFGMSRLPGTAATGVVTFTSFLASEQSAVVPPGVIVRTVGGISFAVTQDQTLPTWSASAGGYVRAAGVATLSVPVACQEVGATGNVSVGAICLMGTAVAGLDTVTNGAPFLNGSDQETDSQLRARFPLWLAAKASASRAAVGNAIANVQTDLSYSLRDGLDTGGNARSGYFTAVVNDGSGVPSDQLLSNVYDAIDSVRALGVGFAVQAPQDLTLNVSMDVIVPSSVPVQQAVSAIQSAVSKDIASTTVGDGYPYSRLSYLAYAGAGVTVTSVLNVRLNGGQIDIPANGNQALMVGNIQINVTQG
ncbi:baseplate J/gp47 family protein [Gluconobacter sp. Dm-74]|uniref:baseplate J/gp47 family protein n=1 Tax=Gluconobacter sp. Dm-74 TaxID=2799803 RepID=UPI001B8BEA6D|nr:baseplate J/gp47 family protein [Gluconobacter sp. Dm-74]MBS1092166.1 baseplate J/gp47 family protein [Gluconobacter sp. Dm-74]